MEDVSCVTIASEKQTGRKEQNNKYIFFKKKRETASLGWSLCDILINDSNQIEMVKEKEWDIKRVGVNGVILRK